MWISSQQSHKDSVFMWIIDVQAKSEFLWGLPPCFSLLLCTVFSCSQTTGREAYSFTTYYGYGIFNVPHTRKRGQTETSLHKSWHTNWRLPCPARGSNPRLSYSLTRLSYYYDFLLIHVLTYSFLVLYLKGECVCHCVSVCDYDGSMFECYIQSAWKSLHAWVCAI